MEKTFEQIRREVVQLLNDEGPMYAGPVIEKLGITVEQAFEVLGYLEMNGAIRLIPKHGFAPVGWIEPTGQTSSQIEPIDAKEARELTERSQADENLKRILGIIYNGIRKNATAGVGHIRFSCEALGIEGDNTSKGCKMSVITTALVEKGYGVSYNPDGISIGW